MEIEFPKVSLTMDHSHSNHLYDHMIGVAKQGKDPGELWCPSGIAIDSNTNQVFIAEGSFYSPRISIFLFSGKLVDTYTHEELNYPWGIAVYRENIYVTDRIQSSVFRFKFDNGFSFVGSVGERGSGRGEFDGPRQLAVSTDGEIFVTDHDNNRIQILASDLEYRREISHQSMKHPCDVKLTPDTVYVLSDTDSPCVHLFSHGGEKLHSLITLGVGMQIARTFFFCVDANGGLVISDWSAHQLKIFSKEGTLLHKLGKLGHEVGVFYLPCGVALTDTFDLVVVSENIDYRLQIFSPLIEPKLVNQ